MMKKTIGCISGVLLFFLWCSQSLAIDSVLKAGEISTLLIDTTIKVTEAKKDKKTGKILSYAAYFADNGTIRIQHHGGETEFFNWSVKKDDTLCVINTARVWGSGPSCGYLVRDNQGGYKVYPMKSISSEKNKKYVSVKKGGHVLTFSNIKKGNQL